MQLYIGEQHIMRIWLPPIMLLRVKLWCGSVAAQCESSRFCWSSFALHQCEAAVKLNPAKRIHVKLQAMQFKSCPAPFVLPRETVSGRRNGRLFQHSSYNYAIQAVLIRQQSELEFNYIKTSTSSLLCTHAFLAT